MRTPLPDIAEVLHGAAGIGKAVLGIDPAPQEVAERRLQVCQQCPSGLYAGGMCKRSAGGCGCLLTAKVRVASERCPHGHW
jgi:hypothetical protein